MEEQKNKYKIQENQYKFPYHHLPHLDEGNNVINHRSINWGFKYFCYLLCMKELVEVERPKSVLDVGCGEGRFLGLLGENIEKKVGVDLSERPILFARAFHPELTFFAKDASQINEEFDVVTAIEVLEHIPDEEVNNFLKVLEERTKRNGHVIICVPTTVRELSEKHYRHYTIDLLKQQIKESTVNLEVEKVEYVYHSPAWLNWYSKITQNRFWIWEMTFIRNFVWKYIRRNLCITNEKYGQELLVKLKKL